MAYTVSDQRRRSSQRHAERGWTCYCGRTVFGNGGISSHKRACPAYREKRGEFVSQRAKGL
jgi:hypothetical protein